jgi:hypothetical protein
MSTTKINKGRGRAAARDVRLRKDEQLRGRISPHLARKAMEYEQLAKSAIDALYSSLPTDEAQFPIRVIDGEDVFEVQWRPRIPNVVMCKGKLGNRR